MATTKALEIRPAIVTDEELEYLDALRLGAGMYLRQHFGVSHSESNTILGYWMRSFAERHPAEG